MIELLGFLLALLLMAGTMSLVVLAIIWFLKYIPDTQYGSSIEKPGKKHISS